MGSWGMCFEPFTCLRCGNGCWINPVDSPCLNCENDLFAQKMSRSIVLQHLIRSGHLPNSLVRTLISYVQWNDAKAVFRKRYLWAMLLSSDSVCRQLTYFHNRNLGNLSQYEDVIDRVLAFVI